MKYFLYAPILILFLNCSTKKATEKFNYSKEICQCLDSLNKTIDTEHSFPICFEIAMKKDSQVLTKELGKSYPDTSRQFLNNFTDELQIKVSIALIDSCARFYNFSDSIDPRERNQNYYERLSTLCFQRGDYDKALVMVEKLLSEIPAIQLAFS
jgi:hypothetical protein